MTKTIYLDDGSPEAHAALIRTLRDFSADCDVAPADQADFSFSTPVRAGYILDKLRHAVHPAHTPWPRGAVFKVAGYEFRPDGSLIRTPNGEIRLTEKERDILFFLYAAAGQTVSRRHLLESLWGYAEGTDTHTLETHIYRLRQKIESDPAKPELIVTVEEEGGYRLAL